VREQRGTLDASYARKQPIKQVPGTVHTEKVFLAFLGKPQMAKITESQNI